MDYNRQLRDHLSFFDKYSIEQKISGSDETLLKNKSTGSLVLMKEIVIESNQQFRTVIDTLESQRCLRHEHLLALIDYEIRPQESPTGVTRKIITFFEYSKHTLEDQIDVRVRQGRPFEENELWSLLCSATLGLAYLQKESVGHGCVSPIDIYLDKEGNIRIADPSIATSSPLDCVQGYYYAPEMLQRQKDVDVFKADVWSLALCVLQAALLEPCDDCYDYQMGTLNYEILQERLDKLSETYTKEIAETILMMLAVDLNERPNFVELQQYLMKLLGLNTEVANQEHSIESGLKTSATAKSVQRSVLRTSQQLRPGLRPLQEEPEEIQSSADDESKCHDNDSPPDTNEEDSSAEKRLESLDINITTNTGGNTQPQTHHIHMRTNRFSDFSQAELLNQQSQQPSNLFAMLANQRAKQCSSVYSSNCQQPPEPVYPRPLLSQNRIPVSITTSKYEQENNRDLMNMSKKASIIIDLASDQKSTKDLMSSNKKPYPEWSGYVYRPSQGQLFTDPKLLMMMKNDLQRIQSRHHIYG